MIKLCILLSVHSFLL